MVDGSDVDDADLLALVVAATHRVAAPRSFVRDGAGGLERAQRAVVPDLGALDVRVDERQLRAGRRRARCRAGFVSKEISCGAAALASDTDGNAIVHGVHDDEAAGILRIGLLRARRARAATP